MQRHDRAIGGHMHVVLERILRLGYSVAVLVALVFHKYCCLYPVRRLINGYAT
jgi:hypothetical protein